MPIPTELQATPIRILVVDDEKGIRFTLSEFLRAAGHQAEMACDAQEALKKLVDMDNRVKEMKKQ